MSESEHTEQSVELPGVPDTGQNEGLPGIWFVAACLVVPVLWGVIVHRIFSRIRGIRSIRRPAHNDTDSVWPDYQI